jgi:hypothetical protein
MRGGVDWLEPTQIYVINPYLLVLTSPPGHVTTALYHSDVGSARYQRGRIEISYRGPEAGRWFHYMFDQYPETAGTVRLWFVNADDAGYRYAHVDGDLSVNVEKGTEAGDGSVTGGIHSGSEFFHVGRYKKNNISPASAKARIRLIRKDAPTVIYVKLWRRRPVDIDAKEDFAYVIRVEP